MARQCDWEYLGFEDDGDAGIHWWTCLTHDKDEMGGDVAEDDEPFWPCEYYFDEVRDEKRSALAEIEARLSDVTLD